MIYIYILTEQISKDKINDRIVVFLINFQQILCITEF